MMASAPEDVRDLQELVRRVVELEHENAHLKRALARAVCGDVMGSTSCQLARGHEGLHAWAGPDTTLIRWASPGE